ncbi:MAG: hypothetical protein IPH57_17960 [Saprospiraceae bacterium]|nr:hypothetical protein [Saprospiraceae bacterium]
MIILSLGCTFFIFPQSVGINQTGAEPHSSAILDVESKSKGFLPPRMTIYQRDAIVSPTDGLMIFNTSSGCPNYYFQDHGMSIAEQLVLLYMWYFNSHI